MRSNNGRRSLARASPLLFGGIHIPLSKSGNVMLDHSCQALEARAEARALGRSFGLPVREVA
jgi:hypothetical protein